jgi:hypothetical protein
VLFVLLFAWYLWAVIDLRLEFQARDRLFLWNVRYFTDFLGQPGALLEWTHHLLVQLSCDGWPGAIAIAATAWLLLVSTIGLMSAVGRGTIGGTWVIPGILVVSLYGDYLFPTSAVVGLTLAVAAANLWCRLPLLRPGLRLALFVAASAVLYYVAGEACYCFAACCAIDEGLAKRRRLWGVLFLLAAAAVKFGLDAALARFNPASHNFHVFSLDRQQPVPLDWRETALYLYFPLCALFVVFRQTVLSLLEAPWRRLRKGREEAHPPEHGQSGSRNLEGSRGAARAAALRSIRWIAGTAVVLLLAAIVGFFSLDRVRKLVREIDYCGEHRLWNEVLAKVEALPLDNYSKSINHDINRALYHKGRLPYQMLCCPQISVAFLTAGGSVPDPVRLSKAFGLLLELGRVNEAERMAFEMFELQPTGATLRSLALIKLIKGQPAAARLLLNVLRDDLVWGRWAEEYLRRLAEDPTFAGDQEIQRIRELMPVNDDLHLTNILDSQGVVVSPDAMLLSLLKRNRTNRMAFEYLMAIRLLNGNLQGVVDLFPFLDDFSYPATPPIYEQAALVYLSDHPDERAAVGSEILCRGRRISAQTVQKFRRLQAILKPFGGPNAQAEQAVARELDGTYFYYFYYTARKRP